MITADDREEAHKRVSNLAGLDENGNILPPPPGFAINRASLPWWKPWNHNDPNDVT